MTIPDTCPNVDIMIDFEKHAWMDTLALRPLTEKGDKWLQRCKLDQFKHIEDKSDEWNEWLVSLRDFEEWFYDLCERSDISLSHTMERSS